MMFKKFCFMVLIMGLIATSPEFSYDIFPNDDVAIRSGVNENAGTVHDSFGLFIKRSGDVSYMEYTLGNTAATDVTLKLWHPSEAGPSTTWPLSMILTKQCSTIPS